jgi:hypothetical protein
MLKFKNDGQQLHDEFYYSITERLRTVLYNLAGYLESNFQKDLVITSLVRLDNKDSVHYYGRGADAETENLTLQERIAAEEFINTNFQYNKAGQLATMIFETKGQVINGTTATADHWHIQTRK